MSMSMCHVATSACLTVHVLIVRTTTMSSIHLHDELAQTHERVVVKTRFGPVTGGRSRNGAAVFLGKGLITGIIRFVSDAILSGCSEVPYALPPGRFENPVPLPSDFRYQDRDYITESYCQFDQFRPLQCCLSTLTSNQMRYSPRTTAKQLVCTNSSEQ